MKVFHSALAVIFLAACRLGAHYIPVHPVELDLKIERTQIRATVRTGVTAVRSEILMGKEVPLGEWPQETRDVVKKYVDEHLKIDVGGNLLSCVVLDCIYIQEPWRGQDEGWVVLQLLYPWNGIGDELKLRSEFFIEEWLRHVNGPAAPAWIPRHFETILRADGGDDLQAVIPIDRPEFNMDLRRHMYGPVQVVRESFIAGCKQFFKLPSLLLLCLSALLGRPGLPNASSVSAASGVFAVAFFLQFYLHFPKPPAAVYWAALLIVAALLLWLREDSAGRIGTAAFAFALGLAVGGEFEFSRARAGAQSFSRTAFAGGFLFSAALAGAAIEAGVRFYRRRLEKSSQAYWRENYKFSATIAQGAMAALSAFQLVRAAWKP